MLQQLLFPSFVAQPLQLLMLMQLLLIAFLFLLVTAFKVLTVFKVPTALITTLRIISISLIQPLYQVLVSPLAVFLMHP
jgi:hypothetical protein